MPIAARARFVLGVSGLCTLAGRFSLPFLEIPRVGFGFPVFLAGSLAVDLLAVYQVKKSAGQSEPSA
jgi:hypothetical protein